MKKLLLAWCFGLLTGAVVAKTPVFILPYAGITAANLAVVVNRFDPLSVQIGEYYQQQRGIPDSNMIYVNIWSNGPDIPINSFGWLNNAIAAKTAQHIQAYALAWVYPYKVGCMSITSAITYGFDAALCQPQRCGKNQPSPYALSNSRRPFDDFGIRPSMLLAAFDFEQAKALIDRGAAADFAADASAAAYLLAAPGEIRGVRKSTFPAIEKAYGEQLPIYNLQQLSIAERDNVMFYFTGAVHVDDLQTNTYLPGAIADHLTSYGGALLTEEQKRTGQMSIMRWLEAGATGSYGTVTEPCAIVEKFPNPKIVIQEYLRGATLIEAYYKSVVMPMQGIFVGDPLARPYLGYTLEKLPASVRITSASLQPGYYRYAVADSIAGPYRYHIANVIEVDRGGSASFSEPYANFYRLEAFEH